MAAKKVTAKKAVAKKAPAKKATRPRKPKKAPAVIPPIPPIPKPPWETTGATPPPLPTNIPPIPTAVQAQAAANAQDVALATVYEWQAVKQRIADATDELIVLEKELRKGICDLYFPTIKEGNNRAALPDGSTLQLTQQYKREFDEAAWGAVFSRLPEGLADRLVQWKPSLKLSAYRQLPTEQAAVFEECLITKPQSPQLAVLPPKEKDS